MADEQRKLQSLSEDFQKLQAELQSTIEARQKLESQEQENKGVQKEFSKLADDANIYKLVGPVLLKQDKNEAVMAVDGRLEFIEKEIKRVEKHIGEIQEKSEKKKMEPEFIITFGAGELRCIDADGTNSQVYQLQTSMQQQQQQAQVAS